MDVAAVFLELYGRIPPLVHDTVAGLNPQQLVATVAPGTNSIGWLVWHLARVEDHHIAELLDRPQLWADGPWAESFGLAADPGNTGYGHGPAEMAAVRPASAGALVSYFDAVHEVTLGLLAGVDAGDLDRIVDRRWDPPVTLGVRLVSVADDCLQHAGQAAFLRGALGA